MHFSTITQFFVLGLMATAPVVADPVDFKKALALRHVGGAANVAHVYANIARSVEAVEGQLMPRHHKGKAKTGNGNANAATGNAATGNTAATNGTTAATTTTTTTTNANCKRHHKGKGNAAAAANNNAATTATTDCN